MLLINVKLTPVQLTKDTEVIYDRFTYLINLSNTPKTFNITETYKIKSKIIKNNSGTITETFDYVSGNVVIAESTAPANDGAQNTPAGYLHFDTNIPIGVVNSTSTFVSITNWPKGEAYIDFILEDGTTKRYSIYQYTDYITTTLNVSAQQFINDTGGKKIKAIRTYTRVLSQATTPGYTRISINFGLLDIQQTNQIITLNSFESYNLNWIEDEHIKKVAVIKATDDCIIGLPDLANSEIRYIEEI